MGLKEAPSRMTLWQAERRLSEEWLHELNDRIVVAFEKEALSIAEELSARTPRASGNTSAGSGGRSDT